MGKPWKELEKKTAEVLRGERINRANDFGISDVDVVLYDLPFLRIDSKFRARHAHHALVEEIRAKYCKPGESYPVLVTKHRSSKRYYVTVDLELFGALIEEVRRKDNEHQENDQTQHVPDEGSRVV